MAQKFNQVLEVLGTCADCDNLEGATLFPEDASAAAQRILCLLCLVVALRAQVFGGEPQ